jgi:hypothetical protein
MSRIAGLKTLRHAWQDTDYRPKPKAPLPQPKTPEQLAAEDRRIAEFLERSGCNRPALNKIIDREARVAVEGDTDLNHDNIEAAE